MATLGLTTQGPNADHWNTGDIAVTGPWVMTEDGTLTSISLWKDGGTSDETICLVVYLDSGGSPGALHAYSNTITITAASAASVRTSASISGTTSLTNGVGYHIGYVTVASGSGPNTADDYSNLAAQGATRTKFYKTGTGAGSPPPDPFAASPSTSSQDELSAYFTYSSGGGHNLTPVTETDSASVLDLGVSTLGNSSGSSGPDLITPQQILVSGAAADQGYIATASGAVTKITVKLSGPTLGTAQIRAVVYRDSGGSPGALVCYTDSRPFTNANTEAEYDFTGIHGAGVLTAGARYWIGIYDASQTGAVIPANNVHFPWAAGASGISKWASGVSDPPPSSFPVASNSSEQLWAYLTFTPSGTSYSITLVSETDEAVSLDVGPESVPRIAAAGLIYLFGDSGAITRTLAPVAETDSALALDIGSPLGWGGPWGGPWGASQLTLTPVTETDSAEPLEILSRHALTSAGETDSALALSITHTPPAVSIPDSLALPLGYREAPDLYGRVVVCDLPSSYYRLDASHYLEDTVGNVSLTVIGAPTLTAGLIGYGTARALSGSDAFTAPSSLASTLGDTFTLKCWFTPAGVTGVQTLFSKGTNAFNLRLDDASLVLSKEGDADILWSDGDVFAAGQTYHIVATKDGANGAHLYVNGEDVSSVVTDHSCQNTLVDLHIFCKSDGTEFAEGAGDEVALYPYPLTADMVAMHFLAGSGEFGVKHFDSDEYPAMSVEIAFDSPWNDPYPRWENVTEDLRVAGLTINASGRADETQRSSPSAAQVLLDNRGRDFDPTNTAGEYGDRILPMRQTRIRFAWETMYWGFKGWADDWTVNEISMGYDSTTTINCVDMFASFANFEFDAANTLLPEQLAGARIEACCDLLGIPDNQRNVDAGLSVMPQLERPEGKILDHILAVADSDGGFLYVGLDGRLVYEQRDVRVAMPVFAIFGDLAPELPYAGLQRSSNTAYLFNRAVVTPGDGNDDAVAEDAASLLEHPPLTYTKSVLTGFNEAQAAAEWYVARYKDPAVRFLSVDLNGASDPDLLWATVLGTVNSLRYRFRRRPLGGGTMELDEYVERIAHKISASGWVITWSLSPFGDEDLWPLDNPAFLLGSNTFPTW